MTAPQSENGTHVLLLRIAGQVAAAGVTRRGRVLIMNRFVVVDHGGCRNLTRRTTNSGLVPAPRCESPGVNGDYQAAYRPTNLK